MNTLVGMTSTEPTFPRKGKALYFDQVCLAREVVHLRAVAIEGYMVPPLKIKDSEESVTEEVPK